MIWLWNNEIWHLLSLSLNAHTHIYTEGDSHDDHDHNPKVFQDSQLAFLVDPVLQSDDINRDGFIDYAEFIAATIKKKNDPKFSVQASSR